MRARLGVLLPLLLLAQAVQALSYAYAGNPVYSGPHEIRVLKKDYFTVGYDKDEKCPAWVCYEIGPATDLKSYKRIEFKADPAAAPEITTKDYVRSGFDRGHMAPKFAISSRFGHEGSDATFTMSNVCPQYHTFNDGQWGDLEQKIAGNFKAHRFVPGWADVYEKVWVVVGPVFAQQVDHFSDDAIGVPTKYFCIVIDEDNGLPRALAFELEHKDELDPGLEKCLTSIQQIEADTHLDFFAALPEAIEQPLEALPAPALWPLPQDPSDH